MRSGCAPSISVLLRTAGVAFFATFLGAFLHLSAAESSAPRRWAVIGAPEVRSDGFSDLLTAELSGQDGLELVEREQIELATKELELSACLGAKDAERRLKLGRLAKADALALLTLVTHDKKTFLKLTISDCRHGARLRVEHFSYEPERRDDVVRQCGTAIRETRERFGTGIRHLVGVTHFLSKNLTHRYDHLQTGFAALLANALANHPGVAVVEIDEARAIAEELNRTAGELERRVVPVFVEGEFEMTNVPGGEEPRVRIVVQAVDGGEVRRRGERAGLTIDQVTELLTTVLPQRLLQLADRSGRGVSPEEQFALLAARANAFSEVGAYEQATALREAALLLQQDQHLQRLMLTLDYQKWLRLRIRESAEGFQELNRIGPTAERTAEFRERNFRRYWEVTVPMFRHANHLVQRRGLNQREASVLVWNISYESVMYSRLLLTHHAQRRLLIETELAEMFAGISQLDPMLRDGTLAAPLRRTLPLPQTNIGRNATGKPYGADAWSTGQQRILWPDAAIKVLCLLLPILGSPDTSSADTTSDYRSTLPHLERLLTQWAPQEEPLPGVAMLLLKNEAGTLLRAVGNKSLQREELKAVYERLRASDHSLLQFYGRCGLLECRFATQGRLLPDDMKELAALQAFVQERCRSSTVGREVMSAYQEAFTSLTRSPGVVFSYPPDVLKALPPLAAGKRHPLTPNPIPPIDSRSLVSFHLLKELEQKADWWELLQADGFDVLWSPQTVHVMRSENRIDKVLTAETGHWFHDVVTDGRNIWVATSKAGVWVVSPAGEVLHRFETKNGFPEYDSPQFMPWMGFNGSEQQMDTCVVLHAAAPGTCVATGVYGPSFRRWIVRLTWPYQGDSHQGDVHVVLTASKDTEGTDAAESKFRPDWIAEYGPTGRDNSRFLILARTPWAGEPTRTPLAIDLKSWAVSVFPLRTLERLGGVSPKFVGDTIYMPSPHRLSAWRSPTGSGTATWTQVLDVGPEQIELRDDTFSQRMVSHRGRLFHAGLRWRSIDPSTNVCESLTPELVPIQHRFRNVANSTFYGLVAWSPGDRMYQVKLREPNAAQEPGPRDEYVPLEVREKHRTAADRIRKLGGSVDGRWEIRIRGQVGNAKQPEPSWGTIVYLPPAWQGNDNDLSLLKELHHVTDLYLVGAPIGDSGLKPISQLESLEALYLEETPITNEGVAILAHAAKLAHLRLESAADSTTKLGDAALNPLWKRSTLVSLTLYGPEFTDQGLAQFRAFPSLAGLTLLECATTRNGLDELRRAKPALHIQDGVNAPLRRGASSP